MWMCGFTCLCVRQEYVCLFSYTCLYAVCTSVDVYFVWDTYMWGREFLVWQSVEWLLLWWTSVFTVSWWRHSRGERLLKVSPVLFKGVHNWSMKSIYCVAYSFIKPGKPDTTHHNTHSIFKWTLMCCEFKLVEPKISKIDAFHFDNVRPDTARLFRFIDIDSSCFHCLFAFIIIWIIGFCLQYVTHTLTQIHRGYHYGKPPVLYPMSIAGFYSAIYHDSIWSIANKYLLSITRENFLRIDMCVQMNSTGKVVVLLDYMRAASNK